MMQKIFLMMATALFISQTIALNPGDTASIGCSGDALKITSQTTTSLIVACVSNTSTPTHTPPSGTATTPTVGTITSNVVPVKFGAVSVTGKHILDVLATTQNGLKYLIRLTIPVDY